MVASTCIDGVQVADDLYHPPVKHSVEIAGHKTSISLEPLFWKLLHEQAQGQNIPLNALIARIDVRRLESPRPPGLATALRLWVVQQVIAGHSAQLSSQDP